MLLPLVLSLLACSGPDRAPAERGLAPTMAVGEVRDYIQRVMAVVQVLPPPKATGQVQAVDLLAVDQPALGGWRTQFRVVASREGLWFEEASGLESLPPRLQARRLAQQLFDDDGGHPGPGPEQLTLVVATDTPAGKLAQVLAFAAENQVTDLVFVARPEAPPAMPADPLAVLARELREERAQADDNLARAAVLLAAGQRLADACPPLFFVSQEMSSGCLGESQGCGAETWSDMAVPLIMECGRRTDIREILVLWAATLPLTPPESFLTRWEVGLQPGGTHVSSSPGETWAHLGPRLLALEGQGIWLETASQASPAPSAGIGPGVYEGGR